MIVGVAELYLAIPPHKTLLQHNHNETQIYNAQISYSCVESAWHPYHG